MSLPKTNVLFITTDQQHWSAMGYLNPEVNTPNLDSLVSSGTTFHRAYTVNPTCTPTRASWITGMYPSQHGAYSLGTKLMEDVPTVGQIFSEHGYRTALVGKAHFQPLKSTDEFPSLESYPVLQDLDFWRSFHGPFYGFEHVELARNHTDEAHVGQHYAIWMKEKGYEDWRNFFRPNHGRLVPGQPWEIPEEIHYNVWIAERTNNLMEECHDNDENFFLWASFFDPHPQYMAPEPYASMYDPDEVTVPEFREGEFDDKPPYFKLSQDENPDFKEFQEPGGNAIHGSGSHLLSNKMKAKNIATMYGMMTMLDKYIGKILHKLDELGLRENTLICFTSDHGDFWGQHGLVAKAIHHYEDLLRVPLVVSMPGTIPAGVRSNSLQSTLDLPQTFLRMANLPIPPRMAGIEESSVWLGKIKNIRDHVMVENQHQPTTMNIRTFINHRYKLTVYFDKEYGELYDLERDPGEYENLWDKSEYQVLKQELLLKFIHAEMAKAAIPMPRIAVA